MQEGIEQKGNWKKSKLVKLEDTIGTMPSQNRRAVQQQVTCLTWNVPEGNRSNQTKFFPTRIVIRGMGQLRRQLPWDICWEEME